MDDLLFQRESIRRALVRSLEQLDKAAEEYDPEEIPKQDVLAAVEVSLLGAQVADYSKSVTHRCHQLEPTRFPTPDLDQ